MTKTTEQRTAIRQGITARTTSLTILLEGSSPLAALKRLAGDEQLPDQAAVTVAERLGVTLYPGVTVSLTAHEGGTQVTLSDGEALTGDDLAEVLINLKRLAHLSKPAYTLEADGRQRRSQKAENYAGELARELRDLTNVGSAHSLAKYHDIDTLKEALWHARNGYRVVGD